MADRRDDIRQKDRTSNKYAAKKAASERLAAQRAAQAHADRRRNVLVAGGGTLAVIAVIVVIVIVGISSKKSASSGANPVVPAPTTVSDAISSAATSTLTSATTPDFTTIAGPPAKISGDALKASDGKPEILYVGAEYCPYCAATRWPLAVALSRFGTFTGLQTTYSSNTDVDPHTPTLSFYQSSYTSQYVDFVSKEQEDGAQKPLETLTTDQDTLFKNLGGGAYPFIDFAGTWMQKGTSYDPATLKGMTPEQVATSIADSSTKSGKAIQAGADVFTAIICESTGGQPANVCTAAGVTAAETALNGSSK